MDMHYCFENILLELEQMVQCLCVFQYGCLIKECYLDRLGCYEAIEMHLKEYFRWVSVDFVQRRQKVKRELNY